MTQRFRVWTMHRARQLHTAALIAGVLLLLAYFGLSDAALQALAVIGLALIVVAQFASVLAQPARAVPVATAKRDTMPDLQDLSTRIHVTADGLVRAAEAIKEVATQQSSGAAEQVDVIKLTNTLLEDFLSLSERINQQARLMTQAAQQAAEISGRGQTAIQQAIQGMDEMRTQVGAIGETILTLATLTRRIDEIITSVSEIATQSNLLALNASIEAARAGAQGRGFSVVADEVRLLSRQSTQAAKQVRAILVEIQAAVKETIRATQVGMQGVDAGMVMTQEANTVMIQLSENVNASHQAVHSIYDVIREQSGGLEEISISMERIDRITHQNLTSTRMVETVSTNLTRLAAELQVVVGLGDAAGSEGVKQ
jgi:methyl-accepting chemotaxis protein